MYKDHKDLIHFLQERNKKMQSEMRFNENISLIS